MTASRIIMLKNKFIVLCVAFIALNLSACTLNNATDKLSGGNQRIILTEADSSPAVLKLVSNARRATKNGQLDRAEVFLERALRLEPHNPVLWNYMAKLRLHQGRYSDAQNLAAKSNSLLRGNPVMQADNWRIIAHARQKSGNTKGANEAQSRSDAILKNIDE